MKSSTKNTFKYTGIVKLSQYTSTKKKILQAELRNAGGPALFNFLTDCLIGDFEKAKQTRPHKIMLLNEETFSEPSDSIITPVSRFFSLATCEKVLTSDKNSSTVRYSFIIPRDELREVKNFNRIGLYTAPTDVSNPSDYAAIVEVKDSASLNLALSSVLVVDWELTISNK